MEEKTFNFDDVWFLLHWALDGIAATPNAPKTVLQEYNRRIGVPHMQLLPPNIECDITGTEWRLKK